MIINSKLYGKQNEHDNHNARPNHIPNGALSGSYGLGNGAAHREADSEAHDKTGHESPYSFRKQYGLGAESNRTANHNGESLHRVPQSYVELGDPSPSMNTTSRPDWLDETDTPAEQRPPRTPANDPDRAPDHTTDHDTGDDTAREDPNHTPQSDSYNGFVDPAEPPTRPEENPGQPLNPMQLEWFVQEDAPDPWSQTNEVEATDGNSTDANSSDGDDGADAESISAGQPEQQAPIQEQGARNRDAHDTEQPVNSVPETEHAAVEDVGNAGARAGTVEGPPRATAIELNLYADRRYRAALERMQFAQWSETLLLLRAVQRDHPHHPTVAALINEVELKAGVVEEWVGKVRGRRLTVWQETMLRRAVPVLLLLLLFAGGVAFYRAIVEPSRQATAITQTTLRIIEEARQMAFAGHFTQALSLYDQVLTSDPGNPLARQGLRETQSLYALTTEYEIAMQVAQAGNLTRAAALLERLLVKAPGFRDAEAQLASLHTQLEARRLFNSAEADYRLQRWTAAVQGYEAVLALGSEFGNDTLRLRLQESYVQAGREIISQWPTAEADATLAQEYFRRAAHTRRNDASIQAELNRLDRFFRGERAVGQSDLRAAVNVWRSLYDEEPQYLGGYLAEQLYRAYLGLANRALQQNDRSYARDLYQLAADLAVQDNREALQALDQLSIESIVQ